ncbi:hypothetical protein SDC9_173674 [bioreactor metagenome]|uniref:Uncharacterized protein n=1 Tax=bioreactor metagenome TaxID=1076179 RepID=A0A645GJC4_9ZZZZ
MSEITGCYDDRTFSTFGDKVSNKVSYLNCGLFILHAHADGKNLKFFSEAVLKKRKLHFNRMLVPVPDFVRINDTPEKSVSKFEININISKRGFPGFSG